MTYFLMGSPAIGNSIERTLNLYKHILRKDIKNTIEVHYTKAHLKDILLCIPIFHEGMIKLKEPTLLYKIKCRIGIKNTPYNKYPYSKYPYGWIMLRDKPIVNLEVPRWYRNNFDIPENSICIHAREMGAWDGKNWSPERSVKINTFHRIALKYADKGYKVIQIGDPKMTKFPEHPNIIRLSHMENKTLMDDFYAISKARVFLATDSGMWPAGVGFDTPTILSNSCHPIDKWWPWKPGHLHLNKKLVELSSGKILSNEEIVKRWGAIRYWERPGYKLLDNTFEELDNATEKILRMVK